MPPTRGGKIGGVTQPPASIARVVCAVLAGAGIAGGATAGLVLAGGLYPGGAEPAPMARQGGPAAHAAARVRRPVRSARSLPASAGAKSRRAAPEQGHRHAPRVLRTTGPRPRVRSARPAPQVPRPAVPARVIAPAPAPSTPAPPRPVNRPAPAPRPVNRPAPAPRRAATFDDSG